ncbi:Uncharacterized protein APZ42_019982 [Daphnia magna]|uniref:Uncharacterized protein n=1 Tax=Daphnia magna TaxID=35525 RepID=A0A0P5WS49_9CRUS|nr:Uncharacterized protein APZ42_019982 [Daphnia magna]
MPVLVREEEVVEWVIEWKVQTKEGEGTTVETLLLDRFPDCFKYFTLTCAYSEPLTLYNERKRWINLWLEQTEKAEVRDTEALCSDREAAVVPTRHYKPSSITVSVCGLSGEAMQREATPNVEKWTCMKSEYSFDRKININLLSFVFSIKFEKIGVVEMVEALEHMTDYFFLQQSHCDVQFCFPNDEEPISGHGKILSSRSSVFAAMFQHKMQESKTGKVFIQDTERDTFYQLLHYIYSGRTWTSLTEGTAQKLLLAADKYNVTQLAKECTSYLISNIQWDGAVDLMIWANLYSIDQVNKKRLSRVSPNMENRFALWTPRRDW